jgi:hypothetical protein
MKRVIAVDDARTWPPGIRAAVDRAAARLDRDLGDFGAVGHDDEMVFRASLAPHLVKAFHATRLLPHEVRWIRDQGLRPLTRQLIADRVQGASKLGFITAEDLAKLQTANVFHDGNHSRAGHVWFFLSRRIFDESVGSYWPLISEWGGEGIYMSRAGKPLRPLLRTLGQPAIVVAGVDLSAAIHTTPGTLMTFLGHRLRVRGIFGGVRHSGLVPPREVLDVWLPGHPEFNKHHEFADAIRT